MKILHHILLGTGLIMALLSQAQMYNASPDLDNIKGNLKSKWKKPVTVNGGLALNSVYTHNEGIGTTNPQPFTWLATGNLNLNLFGYALPFTFTYSNRKVQYSNPSFRFNRFALHPRYKAWTAHIGDISASLSPYTLSGFQYTGGGLEYNKGKWQLQALCGRFLKAVPEDSITTPSYKRMGWGTKMVFTDKGRKMGFSLFHAKDDQRTIPVPTKEANAQVRPMEGTAFALEVAYPVLRNLTIDAEYSTSVLTRDLRYHSDSSKRTSSLLKKLVTSANGSTEIYHAIKAGISYSFAQSAAGLTYERVDPGYQTLGGYFFTSDFENITATISQNLWKGKITASVNAGVQKDDLKNVKQSKMQRFIIAGNLGIHPIQKLNVGLTYSNLQTFTFIRTAFDQINQVTPYQNLDTFDFTQLSQNAALNINYAIKQEATQSQSVSFTGNFMEAANKKGNVIRMGNATRFFNGSINHTLFLPTKELTIATGFNYSYNYAAQINSTIIGPMMNISKTFFKKMLRTHYGIAYNTSKSLHKSVQVWNMRSGVSTRLAKKHNLNTNFVWQHTTGNGMAATSYITVTAGYAYSF